MLKQIIALLLCLTMLVSALPSLVFAEETSDENQMMEIPEETTASEEAATEPEEETTAPTEAVTEPVEETTVPAEEETVEDPAASAEAATEKEEENTEPTVAETAYPEDMAPQTEGVTGSLSEVAVSQEAALASGIVASGSCGGNTTWTLDDQGELVISGTGSTGDYTAFTSPWNGYDSQIRSVVFKDGITRVGEHLLSDSCREITSITFADSVTTIGESAFALCEALTSLTIPGTVKYIGRSAFWANQATTELILCDGIEFIGEGAFESNNLKSVAIPKSVTEIDLFAFRFNANMNSITVDVDNPAYASQDGVLFSKDMQHLIQMPENYLGSYTIPETVVAIDTYAFYGTGVRELTIPRSVTFIGDDAFCWGVGLEEIIFEGDAPVIQDYPDNMGTFTGVNATVYYPAGNPTWTSDVMQNYDGNLTWVPVSVYSGICGDNLEWTFDPDTGNLSITGFGDMYHYSNGDTPWAMHSENIRSVTVADGVTNVGEAAFRFCSGLTQVNLPDTITEIAYGAFADCGSLEEFHVPGNVISISYNAFTNCTGLKEVSVAAISSEAFKNCSSLREVSLPSGVTEIAYATFADCSGLRSVQIPEAVMEIAYSAFDDCSGLQEVTLPAGVTEVAYDAFMDCTGLNRVTLPNNLYSISDGAFRNCVNLTRVVVLMAFGKLIPVSSHLSDR